MRCGCGYATRSWSSTQSATASPAEGPRAGRESTPEWYAAAFAAVQDELHRGNSYEVNLTYREELASPVDPVTAYTRLRAANPAPYAGFLRHGDVALLSSSPERYATIDRHRWLETKPIKGTTPRGATEAEDAAQRDLLAGRPQVPRREPDDRRPAPQRPVDGLRAGHRRGAGADAGGVLSLGAPAGLDGARAAA